MAGVLCVSLFSAFRFLKTTVKDGAQRTFDTFAESFSRTSTLLMDKLDRLTEHPEDMGLGATLVNRIPYPESLEEWADPRGNLLRFELFGMNLDRLDQVTFAGLSFVKRAEENPPTPLTFFFKKEDPERLVLDVDAGGQPLPKERTELVMKSHGFMAGLMVSRYKRLLVPREESEYGGVRDRQQPSRDASPSPGIAPPVAIMTPPPADPEAENRARSQFSTLVEQHVRDSDPLRKRLTEKVTRGAPTVVDVTDLLQAVEAGSLAEAEKNQAFQEILGSPMVNGPYNPNLPAHGMSDGDFQKVLTTVGRSGLIQELKQSDSLKGALYAALERGASTGVTDVKVKDPGTETTPGGDGPDTPALAAPVGAEEYARLHDDEREYQECMNVIQSVEAAHESFMANAMKERPIDIQQLRREGFLAAPPACPTGKSYDLVEKGRRLQCPVHGTRSNPWKEHDRYETFFREYESAVQIGLHQGKPEMAIPKLEAYLRENEHNHWASVLLAELYFQARKFKDAADHSLRLVDRFPHDPRLRYIAGYSFYVIDNQGLTSQHMGTLASLDPLQFDLSQHESLSIDECYVMQDTAAMVLDNLKKGIKFAEFSLQGDPVYPSRVCLENVKQIYELLPRLADAVRGEERFRKLRDNLAKASGAAEKLGSADAQKKKVVLETLEKQKELLKESLLAILKPMQEGERAILYGPCPEKGIYAVDRSFFVQCTRHPKIHSGSKVKVDPGTDVEWEASVMSLALFYDLMNRDEELKDCWEYHQVRTLDEVFKVAGEPGRFEIPADANLDELARQGKIEPSVFDPDGDEKISVERSGDRGIVVCNVHASLLKMHALVLDPGGDDFRPFRHVKLTP